MEKKYYRVPPRQETVVTIDINANFILGAITAASIWIAAYCFRKYKKSLNLITNVNELLNHVEEALKEDDNENKC